MTSNLVETLRTPNGILDWQYRLKCADRIEALEAECQELIKLRLNDNEYKRKLEAALQEIAQHPTTTPFKPRRPHHEIMQDIARRALEGKCAP